MTRPTSSTRRRSSRGTSRRSPRLAGGVLAAASLLAAAPAAHAASIWTPVASGTTDTITSLDHRAAATVFGTSGGKLLRLSGSPLTSTLAASYAGSPIIDVALSPNGTNGIALLSGGRVVRSSNGGISWGSPIQLTTLSPADNSCPFTPSGSYVPLTQEATSVSWASDTLAYVTDNLKGSLERTTNGGATWSEFGRGTDGTCDYPVTATQVVAIPGTSSAYLLDAMSNVSFTSSGFGGTNPHSYFVGEPTMAVDSSDGNQLIGGHLTWSDDGGNTFRQLANVPEVASIAPTRDTSFVGGTAIWVGDAGDIFTSPDGVTAYRQPADGALATTAWKTVSAASASDAMVGGTGGALITTTTANAALAVATPVPTPTPIAAPVATAIPTPVVRPTPTPTPTPTSGSATPGGKTTTTFTGASLTLQGPTACVKAGASFAATMSMRRITIKNNKIVKLTRVDFSVDGKKVISDKKAPFKQTLKVPAGAAGSLHTLKAVGYIKVTKGKAPKKTQTVKFATCG